MLKPNNFPDLPLQAVYLPPHDDKQQFGLRRLWGRRCLPLGTHWMPFSDPRHNWTWELVEASKSWLSILLLAINTNRDLTYTTRQGSRVSCLAQTGFAAFGKGVQLIRGSPLCWNRTTFPTYLSKRYTCHLMMIRNSLDLGGCGELWTRHGAWFSVIRPCCQNFSQFFFLVTNWKISFSNRRSQTEQAWLKLRSQ